MQTSYIFIMPKSVLHEADIFDAEIPLIYTRIPDWEPYGDTLVLIVLRAFGRHCLSRERQESVRKTKKERGFFGNYLRNIRVR